MEHKLSEREPETNLQIQNFRWVSVIIGIVSIGIYLLISTICNNYYEVESFSMEPTLYEGDLVIVKKIEDDQYDIQRGDIIVFENPKKNQEKPYIKRVIGLPGDEVVIVEGRVFIGGLLLNEKYIKLPSSKTGTWEVPDESLFVLGDNRKISFDSIEWGFVPKPNVIGKARLVIWPPEGWQLLNPSTAVAAVVDP